MPAAIQTDAPRYMSVKQVADYLSLNEKKIYALAGEGKIPATKATGKWMFPRELVDRWMLETSHGGALTDRLTVVGSDDPLFSRLVFAFAEQAQAQALASYSPTGTKLGLALMQHQRAEACAIHWGPAREAHLRHPALLRQFPRHTQWVLVRAFAREQGIMMHPVAGGKDTRIEEFLHDRALRWAIRQEGAGTSRFLADHLRSLSIDIARLHATATARSEREAAAAVAMDQADAAPGARSAAREFGLSFVPLGWEYFDLVIEKRAYFRHLFQQLLERLRQPETRTLADLLGGYDLSEAGRLLWSQE
jgi:putative molybdopterin biosynthesis protein